MCSRGIASAQEKSELVPLGLAEWRRGVHDSLDILDKALGLEVTGQFDRLWCVRMMPRPSSQTSTFLAVFSVHWYLSIRR